MLKLEALFMWINKYYVTSINARKIFFLMGNAPQIFEKIFKIIGLKQRIVKHS